MVEQSDPAKIFDVELKYFTSRGNWYHYSWKGDINKSGGIATNIGIHFFDMLMWVFGDMHESEVKFHNERSAAGTLRLERANVDWHLSIDENDLPAEAKAEGKRTFRSTLIDGESFEFSDGFADLHTVCYEKILAGDGFGLNDNKKAIEVAYGIRNCRV
jgi:UDP-N-acetyl-2-amino-2-deoxyglucuronate dehydrogenase